MTRPACKSARDRCKGRHLCPLHEGIAQKVRAELDAEDERARARRRGGPPGEEATDGQA